MKTPTLALLVFAMQCVSLSAHSQSDVPSPSPAASLVTKSNTVCLHTQRWGEPKDLCSAGERTIAENAQFAELIRQRDAMRIEALKPDPATPLFNQCAEKFHYDYNHVGNWCQIELGRDVERLSGFFTKGEAAITADRSGSARLKIMKQIRDEEIDAIRVAQRDRRYRQTALENLIDKANEPCMYADSNNRMQSCD